MITNKLKNCFEHNAVFKIIIIITFFTTSSAFSHFFRVHFTNIFELLKLHSFLSCRQNSLHPDKASSLTSETRKGQK